MLGQNTVQKWRDREREKGENHSHDFHQIINEHYTTNDYYML